jgi:hypothetical protein
MLFIVACQRLVFFAKNKGAVMSTINDVKEVGRKAVEFERKMMFFHVDVVNADLDFISDNLEKIMAERSEKAEKAMKLFEDIGRQICEDHGVAWGSADTENINREAKLSKKAEAKLRKLLDFIAQNS